MESSTPFHLDQALRQWRTSLENLGGIQAEELEELECHLRESIFLLHTRGLSIREAFAIATRRLGSGRQLSEEFAKANPQRTWTERAMWMVVGVLAAYALKVIAYAFPDIVLNCVLRSGLNGHLLGALYLLAGWMVWTGAAATAYWFVSRHSSRRDRVVQACLRQPVLTGLGLFIGLKCLEFLKRSLILFADPVYSFYGRNDVAPSPQTMAIISSWFLWEGLLTQLLWIAAGPLLAGYAWRKRERRIFGSPTSYELPPGEHEAAGALQGHGLSRDEAGLVLAWRRCPQEVIAPSVGLATDRSMWLERAVWIVAGVALNHWLELLVLSLGWLPVIVTRPAAPLYQHLTSLASVCLSLMLGGAIIAGLWKWVTRHPNQSASIGGICGRRPLLAAIGLVAVCAGIALSEYALFTYAAKRLAFPAQISMRPIASQWFMFRQTLTQLIIPIALLLWLARRVRSIRSNPALCR